MKTLITGYYNIDINNTNPLSGFVSLPGFIDKYPNSLTVVTIEQKRIAPVPTAPFNPLFYEFYTWATYNDSTFSIKLGEISYNCLYPDNSFGITSSPSIQKMTVVGADGIYSNINQVIMDFRTPPIRTVQFNNV